ncbi:hypothetical protein [Streptomyces sp. 8L]|uniref:hypothetical protein n=1 Tax=Streptomyces sp. 8L TaxID=2877242 RepID=UPI001CD667E6|nr:hypothetical protein [Streptomyces sp. 8L]MCA1218693.1 hypothetical protein [Streptomyces sp. 8L]
MSTPPATDPNAPAAPPEGEPNPAEPAGTTDEPGTDQLGDAGKRAIDAMKQQRNAARDSARPWTDLADELGLTPEEIRAKLKPAEPDPAQMARDAQREAVQKANRRILRAEVKAAAAGRLRDAGDALVHLDLDKFAVGEDGDVDQDELSEALDDLLARKPYLAKDDGPRTPAPDPAQGARPDGGQSIGQQIAEAEAKGDWNTSRRLKQAQMLANQKTN